MRPRSAMTLSIIKLHAEGRTKSEIARLMGCTWQHVNHVLRREREPQMTVAALPEPKASWLATEAARAGVSVGVMARAMLIDAIEEEMDK